LGLISGTSADGIDAALVGLRRQRRRGLLPRSHLPRCPESLREPVLARVASSMHAWTWMNSGELDTRLGRHSPGAAERAADRSRRRRAHVRAIGSHGQTLRHRPLGAAPFTLQLGDANVIAKPPASTPSPISAAATSPPAARARRWCPAFHAATLADAVEDRACSTSAASPT
jgi:anhydro-N-acetylmuramic acid kinase